MDPIDHETAQRILKKENVLSKDRLLVGVSITQRLLSHAFEELPNCSERYFKAVAQIAKVFDMLVDKQNAEIIFVPHCIGPQEERDDRIVARDIFERMKNKTSARVIMNEYSAQELKGLIGQLNIFIGDRIHALISALSMSIPCCTLSYRTDRRPKNLIGEDYKQQKWIYEVDNFDAHKLEELLERLIASSDDIRRSLPSVTKTAKDRALFNGLLLKRMLSSKC